MSSIGIVFALAGALATAAGASWEPAWSGPWRYDTEPRGVTPMDVRVGADGRVFALFELAHDGESHTALARFDEGGAFVWLREREGFEGRGMQVLPDGDVAVVDAFGPVVRVRVYGGDDGTVVWEDQFQAGRIAAGSRQIVLGGDGVLLIPAVDGNDVVVARYTPRGERLPDWRWSPGIEDLLAEDIVAAADGGAVVGVAGDMLTGGFLVVRFDADGQVVFHDRERGGLGGGTFNRRLFLAIDGAGDVLAQGALQNSRGDMQAQVWKIAADGARLWTRVLVDPIDERFTTEAVGLVLDANGDPVLAQQAGLDERFRLLRLDSASGALVQNEVAQSGGVTRTLTRAPNGRVLVGGTYYIDFQGHVGARMAEFDADLRPCRSVDLGTQYFSTVFDGGAQGWTGAGGTLFGQTSNDAHAMRYDADGACDRVDAIFADGFEDG
ncbi:hypothetical protein [Dokdonella sp.]|uniref:hypothetical protein n=1 Tax=Dokdonella sp. TaxID=2291710 RepID=UPI001B004CDA|nr:hypothetical protein [Dokdonella sp.]MBO9663201.1 hypothetical protein [Dokdonella sp.]